MQRRQFAAGLLFFGALGVVVWGGILPVAAHGGHSGDNGSQPAPTLCLFPNPDWRNETTIAGVHIRESRRCRPDNPYGVAVAVKGTNNVPNDTLLKTGYARDAVRKRNDRDGDGDPDAVRITLEVQELNGGSIRHPIAPGVAPTMWVFAPKTRGMVDQGSAANRLIRAPSPPIRVEQGDTMYVTLENTHYFPHTIHFHGVDHPYETQKPGVAGNDGVPQTSERPIPPGERRTYKFTPNQTGTMFYHCHVVPSVHVQMGLTGIFTIVKDEPNNWVQTYNIGAGVVRHPPKSIEDDYRAVYDLHYQALNKQLTAIPAQHDDPRNVSRLMNREHDSTDGTMDYYLLNGRSFPYTIQESPIVVEPGARYRLRILNSGPRGISLHTHGHKFVVEAYDGVELAESNEIRRDVIHLSPAQRVDLTLNTTIDGTNSYGRGVWLTHDHREPAVTTNGISPGGNINVIVYRSYLNETTGLPQTNVDLGQWFNASYYNGTIPYWSDIDDKLAYKNTTSRATVRAVDHWGNGNRTMMDVTLTEHGVVVNENTDTLPYGCRAISGTRHLTIRAGETFAAPGEMFAYNRSEWHVDPCTRVEVTLVNTDEVRHQWMVHGLTKATYPMGMFNVEANGNASVTGTFITPGLNTTLAVHCSVPEHEAKGMAGKLIIGDPTQSTRQSETGPLSKPVLVVAVAAIAVLAVALLLGYSWLRE